MSKIGRCCCFVPKGTRIGFGCYFYRYFVPNGTGFSRPFVLAEFYISQTTQIPQTFCVIVSDLKARGFGFDVFSTYILSPMGQV